MVLRVDGKVESPNEVEPIEDLIVGGSSLELKQVLGGVWEEFLVLKKQRIVLDSIFEPHPLSP